MPNYSLNLPPVDILNFPEPWYSSDIDLTVQLRKELGKDHILHSKTLKTIARRQDNDDVIFEVKNADFKYALVHLTWTQRPSDNATYPKTSTFESWQDLYERILVKAHEEWKNEP